VAVRGELDAMGRDPHSDPSMRSCFGWEKYSPPANCSMAWKR
jgi:hypothetical protein